MAAEDKLKKLDMEASKALYDRDYETVARLATEAIPLQKAVEARDLLVKRGNDEEAKANAEERARRKQRLGDV